MTPHLMDASETAALLKCSVRTVEDYARAGTLPGVKFGDGWMFPMEALMRAVNRLAEEEAVKRLTPRRAHAVKKEPRAAGRPNLALLT